MVLEFMHMEVSISEQVLEILRKHLNLDKTESDDIKLAIKSIKKVRKSIENMKTKYSDQMRGMKEKKKEAEHDVGYV